ncbi:MAG: hypothetical protein ACTS4W_01730 [Candidatus Hodgkinia cicadicola]
MSWREGCLIGEVDSQAEGRRKWTSEISLPLGRLTYGGLVKSLEREMSESSPVKLAEGELRFWFC